MPSRWRARMPLDNERGLHSTVKVKTQKARDRLEQAVLTLQNLRWNRYNESLYKIEPCCYTFLSRATVFRCFIVSNETVLVVEDDANMQDFLKEVLASEGLIVHTASDGKEALNKTLALTPDLVLLDLRMPNLDGVTYCKAVRLDKHTKNIPIIVVTSLSMQSKLEESIAAGADDFVAKPFDVNDLLLRVRSMLKVQHITDTQERMQRYILSLRHARGEASPKV